MPTMSESSSMSPDEELKLLANDAFKANKYSQAIDLYTQAIELNSWNAVYWANRAFAHTKLEEYGSAIQDATKAIEIDPKYSKGYYRRGAAYLAMGKYKYALKDFQQVKRICPKDPDAAKKLKECEKAVMKLKLEEAIAVPESARISIADSVDYRSIAVLLAAALMAANLMSIEAVFAIMALAASIMLICFPSKQVEPQYSGAKIEEDTVTLDFVKSMMEDFKNQKSLHKKYAFQIVVQTRDMLRALPSLVDITVLDGRHFTVCGDVHGQVVEYFPGFCSKFCWEFG